MAQVVDYSAGFPGAQRIRSAGYAGAVRYIGFPDRRKCTTAGELADFDAHGLGMALVYENTLTEWRGGLAAGKTAGGVARAHANAIGFPRTRPIYVAIDQDVVTAAQFDSMVEYVRGFSETQGEPGAAPHLTGVYGETDVINRARAAGVAAWYWDTTAWSRGVIADGIHLRQLVATVAIGGVACDVNDVHLADWGQHNMGDDVSWNDAITNPNYERDKAYGAQKTYLASDWLVQANLKAQLASEISARVEAKVDALAGTLTDDEANIIAAVRGQQAGDPAAFAAILAPLLGPMIASGATPEQVQAAVDTGVRSAFARAGATEGNPS